jgi:hypothetical membrane protein
VCWLAAGVGYLGLEGIAAHALPGYDYVHDYISDLGRPDSPLSPVMNAAFVFQGTLFFAGAAFLRHGTGRRRARILVACAAANAVGNIVVATVHGGPTGLAWLHIAGAALAIVGGNAAILAGSSIPRAGRCYRAISVGLAVLGLLSFVLLAIDTLDMGVSATALLPGPALERTSVYTIIGWQVLSAFRLIVPRAIKLAPSGKTVGKRFDRDRHDDGR